jgi:glycosyltransferase involved in cell wall biosynthesis
MRIIIVNTRFFISGGPERYFFNIINLLEKHGHTVIPFSVKHNKNSPTPYESYFLDPIGDGDEVYFKEYKTTDLDTFKKTVSRMLYSTEAKKKMGDLIREVRPDLIYVLNYQNKISVSIFDAAAKENIPVVLRISDFGQVCANTLLYVLQKNEICERCVHGSKWNAVKYKCLQNSYLYSMVKVASLTLAEDVVKVRAKIKAYVVPSSFTIQKLSAYGIEDRKLNHIPTFFNNEIIKAATDISYQPFALFVGRIVQEKGLLTLVKAFANTPFHLKIIGFSNSDYQQELDQYLADKTHHIEFLGRKTFEEIVPYLQTCSFTLVPSETYDNFPNTVLESYAFNKPVIATDLGSLKEMVIDKKTGLLFRMQDEADLREKITLLMNNPQLCQEYGENGFIKLQDEYGAEMHYEKLMRVFDGVLSGVEQPAIA